MLSFSVQRGMLGEGSSVHSVPSPLCSERGARETLDVVSEKDVCIHCCLS